MRVRGCLFLLVPVVGAVALAACGGGGGGYNSPMMPPPPPPPAMPTVTFTAPTQATSTINFGRAVTLTWSSTGANSCTASTSSTIGGTFTGTQSTSNTATVVPTAPGTVTYTLTCTGTGGSASATANVTVSPNILSTLSVAGITTIGSTTPASGNGTGDNNPYGLAIAPATAGPITKGDLVVCNFNAASGTQGTGTTIVGLHPTVGASNYVIAQDANLTGCNALAMLPDDSISAATAATTNPNPLVTSAGVITNPFAADSFGGPWGEAYAPANGSNPAALYVSNLDGTVDRISLNGDAQTAFTPIAAGFCHSGGPGAYFAPSGLTYDASIDTLYIVDTSSYSVVAFANVSSIGANGVVVSGQCQTTTTPPTPAPTFSGPSATSARVVATGGMFIAPLSAALLPNHDLLVENADININMSSQTPDLVFEISPVLPGGFVGQPVQLVNDGQSGALFGIAITTDANNNPIVYFNDDTANSTTTPPNNVVMKLTTAASGSAAPPMTPPPGY
jgi:hypothetical protein